MNHLELSLLFLHRKSIALIPSLTPHSFRQDTFQKRQLTGQKESSKSEECYPCQGRRALDPAGTAAWLPRTSLPRRSPSRPQGPRSPFPGTFRLLPLSGQRKPRQSDVPGSMLMVRAAAGHSLGPARGLGCTCERCGRVSLGIPGRCALSPRKAT